MKLLHVNDKFWFDNTARTFAKDLNDFKQSIIDETTDKIPKNAISRSVEIKFIRVEENTSHTSSGSLWQRTIIVDYNIFFTVRKEVVGLDKLLRIKSITDLVSPSYWSNRIYEEKIERYSGSARKSFVNGKPL